MSDTQMIDPNSWLTKFRATRPDLFPNGGAALPGFVSPQDAQSLAAVNADRARRGWAPLGSANLGGGFAPPTINPQGGIPGLPPMSPFSGSLSAQPLGGGNLPATPPQPSAPPPTYPDLSQYAAAKAQLEHSQAVGAVNPYQVQGVENAARTAGLQTQIGMLPQHDPSNPAFNWQNITPQSLGTPQMVPVATRPAPQRDMQSSILAALGGIFDPKGAGAYNAVPLQTGIDVANKQYQDQLQQNALLQQQYLQQYDAGRANAAQNNQFATLNQEQGQRSALAGLSDAQRLQEQAAGLGGQLSGSQSLAGGLSGLGQQASKTAGLGADIQSLTADMEAKKMGYASAVDLYKFASSAEQKYFAARLAAETKTTVADTNKQGREYSSDNYLTGREYTADQRSKDVTTQQSGANSRNAATNATSTANNIRNNAGAPDGGVTDQNLLKVPEVAMANSQYMKTLDVYNKLLAQQARDHNPTPLGSAALTQTQTDLRNAKAYLDSVFVKAKAAQTPTPGGVGGTTNNTTGTAPGVPAAPTFRYDATGHRIP